MRTLNVIARSVKKKEKSTRKKLLASPAPSVVSVYGCTTRATRVYTPRLTSYFYYNLAASMSSNDLETASSSTFEKQREQLVQEIAAAMDSVVSNLDTLNRTLKESVQVGNGFQDTSKLWATFYNGAKANPAPATDIGDVAIASKPAENDENQETGNAVGGGEAPAARDPDVDPSLGS